MTARRSRHNGEGSIFPYRNGFAAYVWVRKPDGKRGRKWVYGPTREAVHEKWVKLQARAAAGPVPTSSPTVEEYLTSLPQISPSARSISLVIPHPQEHNMNGIDGPKWPRSPECWR